jgi:hypothetical protein
LIQINEEPDDFLQNSSYHFTLLRGGEARLQEHAMTKRILAIGIVLLLFSPVALAQQQSPAPAPQPDTAAAPQPGTTAAAQQTTKGACVADIKEKCDGVEPGQGRIGACVKEHLAELSQPCQARLAKLADAKKACAADLKKDCAGMIRARRMACITRSLRNLSEPCKAELSKAVAGRS